MFYWQRLVTLLFNQPSFIFQSKWWIRETEQKTCLPETVKNSFSRKNKIKNDLTGTLIISSLLPEYYYFSNPLTIKFSTILPLPFKPGYFWFICDATSSWHLNCYDANNFCEIYFISWTWKLLTDQCNRNVVFAFAFSEYNLTYLYTPSRRSRRNNLDIYCTFHTRSSTVLFYTCKVCMTDTNLQLKILTI